MITRVLKMSPEHGASGVGSMPPPRYERWSPSIVDVFEPRIIPKLLRVFPTIKAAAMAGRVWWTRGKPLAKYPGGVESGVRPFVGRPWYDPPESTDRAPPRAPPGKRR